MKECADNRKKIISQAHDDVFESAHSFVDNDFFKVERNMQSLEEVEAFAKGFIAGMSKIARAYETYRDAVKRASHIPHGLARTSLEDWFDTAGVNDNRADLKAKLAKEEIEAYVKTLNSQLKSVSPVK
jgi:hypothetical protein